jgi:hypothetical protein
MPNIPQLESDTDCPGAAMGSVRLLLRLEAGLVLGGAVLAYRWLGGGWSLFAMLFLLPDLAMVGYLLNARVGARSYNVSHTYLSAALPVLIGRIGGWPILSLISLIWCAHIGFDRLLGYGLKYSHGFGATHLGRIGKNAARSSRYGAGQIS